MRAKGHRFLSTETPWTFRKRILILVLGTLLLCLQHVPAVAGGSLDFFPPVKVMTQNLYVGADIFYPAGAEDPNDFFTRFFHTVGVIVQTNIRERAQAIAEEVAVHRPHLIGLQEVYSIDVDLVPLHDDYLSILLEALQAKGLDYKVAGSVTNMDLNIDLSTLDLGLVRLTDHDVILARSDVETSPPSSQNYEAKLQPLVLPLPFPSPVTVDVLRGFVAVEATVGGKKYVFVTTHLELRGKDFDPVHPNPLISAIQALQAQALIGRLASETRPVIVVGDLNSDPGDPVSYYGPLTIVPPYKQFVLNGYRDVWRINLLRFLNPQGFTCCQAEALDNPESQLSERIDHIFVRNMPDSLSVSIVGPVVAYDVGDEPSDIAPGVYWPSDHAGVVARMLIPSFK